MADKIATSSKERLIRRLGRSPRMPCSIYSFTATLQTTFGSREVLGHNVVTSRPAKGTPLPRENALTRFSQEHAGYPFRIRPRTRTIQPMSVNAAYARALNLVSSFLSHPAREVLSL
jgi:hypothetical protein